MSFSFHPKAERELNRAIEYYENIESGFGYDFATEVYTAIKRCVNFPKAWTTLEGDVRRSLVNRYPYGILYSIEDNGDLFIISVMNLNREPDFWKNRI